MLNNLIEVASINSDMTDEIMYKTCIQFFSDGYWTASQVTKNKFSTVALIKRNYPKGNLTYALHSLANI